MTMEARPNHAAAYRPRVEDNILVRGHGRYIADETLPNQAYAHFVRSPHAFARIVKIDTEAARAAPGVVAILTAEDMAAGLKAASQGKAARPCTIASNTQNRRAVVLLPVKRFISPCLSALFFNQRTGDHRHQGR